MQIIDGFVGAPNIYADDIGQYNISLFGEGDYVLPVGEQLGYELVSNNEIQIKDGLFVTQGRRGIIKKGTVESCIIENGTQAEKRNDLIVIEYSKDEATLVESHVLKVIKGKPGEAAVDPQITTGDIPGGGVLHHMPLYRVKLEGLNVTAVEQLFEIGMPVTETVDPTLATKKGYAADAYMTGKELESLNSKIAIAEGTLGDIDVPVQINLPDGFTRDNCIVISVMVRTSTDYTYVNNAETYLFYDKNGVLFCVNHNSAGVFTNQPIKIFFMKLQKHPYS